ncbi:hypothetical protein CKO51_28415 [Rhodopirellula sp. SM50]|nr:hypothetical protein CKO51_28415 [Rhodopirellula sp. SM50]
MVALLVPATLLGFSIGPAVVLHEGSTIVVVLNAFRLLAFRKTASQTLFKRLSAAFTVRPSSPTLGSLRPIFRG